MRKAKTVRIAGFFGALCASVALVGFSVAGTGAYFSDSHTGEVDASTGQIKVDISPADGKLHFDNLLPGDYQTKRIDYTARPVGGTEDIWLVFPNAETANDAFIQHPKDGATPLGRYGHFGVTSTGGANFQSSNLALSPNGGYTAADACSIDANGEGGETQTATKSSDLIPYCAPAHAILLQSNLSAGDTGHADLTFGFTPLLTGPQGSIENKVEDFDIVATQHGVRPDNS